MKLADSPINRLRVKSSKRNANAPTIAPLSVPLLLGAGGAVLVFGVFGVAFLLAAGAALVLPEQAGRELAA